MAQAQTEKKRTKTDAVREILKEIGALVDNPPEGWRKQVEDALKKQKMDMHTVTIYQIRQREMQRLQEDGEAPANGKPKKAKKKGRNAANLTLGDVREIQKFAARFGGLTSLSRACQEIQTLVR